MNRYTVIFLLSLCCAISLQAIVVENYTIAEQPPPVSGEWDLNWDYVYRYKGSSSVAIAPHWLITAAHVADDPVSSMVTINGTNYIQQEIIFHSADFDPSNTERADLALVRFDKAFPGYYPLYTGSFPTFPPAAKKNSILVGYGRTGAVFQSHFTWGSGGQGIKRWGTQRIDALDTRSYLVEDTSVTPTQTNLMHNIGFRMDFNLGDTPYEAGVNIYDSGGGSFIKDNGTWKLAGIITTVYGTSPNFNGIFAVSMPDYYDWIMNVIDPLADLDGDGIPNYWEQSHSVSIVGLEASEDLDGDGFTNLQEYIANTDPTNAESNLRFTGLTTGLTQTVYFDGSTSRVYRVYSTDNELTTPEWAPAHSDWVPGTGLASSISISNHATNTFFQLRVKLPPPD